jgi:rsbT co-antagonist protein RsbR
MADRKTALPELLRKHQTDLLRQWQSELSGTAFGRASGGELEQQQREFLELFTETAASQTSFDQIGGEAWRPLRELLEETSRSRCLQGFSSDETARFIFSIKRPLFRMLQTECGGDADEMTTRTWEVSQLIDQLGLYTIRTYQETREDIINRQQQELLELSTPVVKLWDGILALPMIGTLDSGRTQVVMESLLQRIVDTGSELAIIDITGVPTVDTLVAQHLLKTVTAIRLMGADCIVSGVRPQIAQTIVHLGVDLQGVVTKATLADALALALRRSGYTITKPKAA